MTRPTTTEVSACASCVECAWASDGWGDATDRRIAARFHVDQTGHRASLSLWVVSIVGPS